jgi:hypothetical protein
MFKMKIFNTSNPLGNSVKGLFLLALFYVGSSTAVRAHEPIFGIGPRTIWMYGLGFEARLNIQSYTREAMYEMDYHTIFGLNADWAISLSTHQPLNTPDSQALQFGNLGISTKYRFFRNDVEGGVYHAAVLGGVELPIGDDDISPNTTDVIAGLSGAYEGRRWLMFTTGRYRLNTNLNGIHRGDAFLYDIALGIRPIQTGYYDPDVVLMAEFNGQIFGANKRNGQVLPNSKGDRLFAGFGAWITYRNWAFKPGIQLPVYDNVGRENPVPRFTFGIEFHI